MGVDAGTQRWIARNVAFAGRRRDAVRRYVALARRRRRVGMLRMAMRSLLGPTWFLAAGRRDARPACRRIADRPHLVSSSRSVQSCRTADRWWGTDPYSHSDRAIGFDRMTPPPRHVCVYCSSSAAVDRAHVTVARELGAALGGEWGDVLVWGGATVGLMGEVARAGFSPGRRPHDRRHPAGPAGRGDRRRRCR